MWKVLISFLLFQSIFAFAVEASKNHLQKEFPHALLTSDFGVLAKDDLKINSCMATPVPFSKDNGAYSYWQCFEIMNSQMTCEGRKYSPDSKSRVSLLVLLGVRDGEPHEFISRRTMPLDSCRLYQKNWKKLTKNEKYVCISGSMSSKGILDGKVKWTWIFDRYKTKKGCDSYFEGECSLQYQISHNRCAE